MCPLAVVYWYQWLQRNLGFYWELVLSQVPTALMGLQYARPTRIEGTATRTQWSGLGAEDVRGPGLFEARNRRMTLRHQILLNPSTMMSIARQLLRYRENTHDSRLAERIIIGLWRNTTFLKGILQGYKACSTVALWGSEVPGDNRISAPPRRGGTISGLCLKVRICGIDTYTNGAQLTYRRGSQFYLWWQEGWAAPNH